MAADSENYTQENERVGFKGWFALTFLVCLFSGIFNEAEGPLKALDILNLTGVFGRISTTSTGAAVNFQGIAGTGAKAGFLVALGLIPGICLAVAFVGIAEEMGAMKAAQKVFNPLLKPLMGLNGDCGVALVASLNSSDVGSVMTRQLYEDRKITDTQRTIFIAYQYPGSALVFNVINSCGVILPIIPISLGLSIVVLFVVKVIGANIVRLYFFLTKSRRESKEAAA